MHWIEDSHIVIGDDPAARRLKPEAKRAILAFSALVIGIVLALAALAGAFK